MDFRKIITEKVLLDTAMLLAIISAFLYGAGFFAAEGMIAGYGLSSEILTLELWTTLLYGFVALLAAPFIGSDIWLVSLIGLLPVILKIFKKKVHDLLLVGGILFFIFFQFAACFVAGERGAGKDIEEFSEAYKTDTLHKLEYKQAKLQIENGSTKEYISGFTLEIPGDYFVLIQQNRTRAIRKSLISQIEYQWPSKPE